MNKGVELLLARRRTHPDEFAPHTGRWVVLLYNHHVDLNNPEQEIKNPDVFTHVVMHRLLTANDLEPKEGKSTTLLTSASMRAEALAILEKAFDDEYAKYNKEHEDEFNGR